MDNRADTNPANGGPVLVFGCKVIVEGDEVKMKIRWTVGHGSKLATM